MSIRKQIGRIWKFIWEDNSIWSWIINIVLAFILIKFIVYPGLGLALGTTHPIVAVVSGSMEHGISYEKSIGAYTICGKVFQAGTSVNLDSYWRYCGDWYEKNTDIKLDQFSEFPLNNGFNKGDIIILKGEKAENIKSGDIIVYQSGRPDPIIHRVVGKRAENGRYIFSTKGDHNPAPIIDSTLDETSISQQSIIGKSAIKIPLLGYIKIWFVELTGGNI